MKKTRRIQKMMTIFTNSHNSHVNSLLTYDNYYFKNSLAKQTIRGHSPLVFLKKIDLSWRVIIGNFTSRTQLTNISASLSTESIIVLGVTQASTDLNFPS